MFCSLLTPPRNAPSPPHLIPDLISHLCGLGRARRKRCRSFDLVFYCFAPNMARILFVIAILLFVDYSWSITCETCSCAPGFQFKVHSPSRGCSCDVEIDCKQCTNDEFCPGKTLPAGTHASSDDTGFGGQCPTAKTFHKFSTLREGFACLASHSILTSSDCQNYAKEVKHELKTFSWGGVQNTDSRPRGCYYDDSTQKLRFNEQPNGELLNLEESKRTYSTVWNDENIGTGHARSMIWSAQAWSSKTNNVNGEWVQMEFNKVSRVIGVVTQGRKDYSQWVTKYRVATSMDGITYTYVDGGPSFHKDTFVNAGKVFEGNKDRGQQVKNIFESPVLRAFYVRIYPRSFYGHMSMRFAVQIDTSTVTPCSQKHKCICRGCQRCPRNTEVECTMSQCNVNNLGDRTSFCSGCSCWWKQA